MNLLKNIKKGGINLEKIKKYFSRSFMLGTAFLFLLITWSLLFSHQFSWALEVKKEVGVSVTIEEEVPPPPPQGGGGWVAYATAIFKGKAYPGALVTILKNGIVATTFKADTTGYFSESLTGLPAKIYTFGIWAEDSEGRKSLTLNYSISLIGGKKTTMEIFLPPTFELDTKEMEQGEDLAMAGQTFPLSNLNIFVNGLAKKTSADKEGKWSYKLDTTSLALGTHTAKVQSQTDEGEQSPFSQTLSFLISPPKCRGADLNFDDEVNIIDFSILLYFWHSTSPENICADINQDGIVNLIDFSIMMYQWTG
jgi:hypothetical protein